MVIVTMLNDAEGTMVTMTVPGTVPEPGMALVPATGLRTVVATVGSAVTMAIPGSRTSPNTLVHMTD